MQTCSFWLTVSYGSVVWCQKHGFWTQTYSGSNPTSACPSKRILKKIISFFFSSDFILSCINEEHNHTDFLGLSRGFEEIMYSTYNRCLGLLLGEDHRFLEKAFVCRTQVSSFWACCGHFLSLGHYKSRKVYIDQSRNYYNSVSYICIEITWCSGKIVGISVWYPRLKCWLWHLFSPIPLLAR